jgi:pyruvate carboxylase
LGDKVQELKEAYTAVNHLFGRIVKVTPSSKVVGDLALFMVANELSVEELVEQAETLSLPESVISFLRGEIGIPYGGFPEEFRSKVLKGEEAVKLPPLPPADFEKAAEDIQAFSNVKPSNKDVLSYLLYPKVFKDFAKARDLYGQLMVLPSEAFFYGLEEGKEISVELEPGKLLYISLVTLSEPDEKGKRTVFFDLNGQTRGISVSDKSSGVTVEENQPADPSNPAHVGAPLAGVIVELNVSAGDQVKAGDALFILEAMKMQTVVSAQADAKIAETKLKSGTRVSGGDLVLTLAT